jgi:hypothetical protein
LIGINNTLESFTLRVEDITIDCKAMSRPMINGLDFRTKAEERNLFVRIIVLKDGADRPDSLEVLVFLRIKVVKRVRIAWISI